MLKFQYLIAESITVILVTLYDVQMYVGVQNCGLSQTLSIA